MKSEDTQALLSYPDPGCVTSWWDVLPLEIKVRVLVLRLHDDDLLQRRFWKQRLLPVFRDIQSFRACGHPDCTDHYPFTLRPAWASAVYHGTDTRLDRRLSRNVLKRPPWTHGQLTLLYSDHFFN